MNLETASDEDTHILSGNEFTTLFQEYNSVKLENLLRSFPLVTQKHIRALPLFFHLNQNLFPGFINHNIPHTIFNYIPDDETVKHGTTFNSAFDYTPPETVEPHSIDAIYLQDHIKSGRLILWVVHSAELDAKAISLLKLKANAINKWREARHIKLVCHVARPHDMPGLYWNNQFDSIRPDKSIFLDEFYGECILLAGKARACVTALGETGDSAGAPLHRVVAWDPVTGALSGAHTFRVKRDWTLLADVDDPAGDDAGPAGRYVYPTDPQWQAHPLDLRRIRVYGASGALKVEVTTQGRLAAWNPPNGFDHAVYNLFVQLPGREGGATAMPLQNAVLPEGMRWHLRARANGWTNALFDARGAGPGAEGEALTPAAALSPGPGPRTVTFTLPATAMGRPRSLSGLRLYVNTLDFDGGYRPLQGTAGDFQFGGGDGRADPLWIDESGVITLH